MIQTVVPWSNLQPPTLEVRGWRSISQIWGLWEKEMDVRRWCEGWKLLSGALSYVDGALKWVEVALKWGVALKLGVALKWGYLLRGWR